MDAEIPNELTGPLPRRVRATRLGFWMVTGSTILSTAALAATFWLGKGSAQQWQHSEALRSEGIETVGRVTEIDIGKAQTVYYKFTVNGVSFAGKAVAPVQILQRLQGFDSLIIRYVPANPVVNHPADWELAPLDSVWFMLPFPLVLFGVLFLISLYRERQLVVHGVPVVGVIAKCSFRSRGGWVAKYEFRTEDGNVRTKTVGVPNCLETGTRISVLYLPQSPRRSQIYPSPNYCVAR